MYKAIFFNPDGDSVTDFNDSETIEYVWDCIADMGSRWIFFPIPFVADEDNDIVSAPEGMEYWVGKSRKEIKEFLEKEWKERAEEICKDINNGVPLFLIY